MRADPTNFWTDERGALSIEAIWTAVFLSIFIIPTVVLLTITSTQLGNSMGTRSAARNEAINNNCSGNFFLPVPIQGSIGNVTANAITCTRSNAESDFSQNARLMKRLEATSSAFSDFMRAQKAHGRIDFVTGSGTVVAGGPLAATNFMGTTTYLHGTEIKVPDDDTWTFSHSHWARGHDQVIWERLGRKSQRLFPNVFPSRN